LRHWSYQGISFYMPVSKKSAACKFSHVLTRTMNSTLLLKRCETVLQVSKQMVVTCSKVRAIRRVVKWLPVEMLQQCWSVNSYMWTCIVMEEHHTGCQHSMPFGLNGTMQFFFNTVCTQCTCDIVVPCCVNSTISTRFQSQGTVAFSFLAVNVCLNFSGLFGECVCIDCFDCSLVSTFTNETQV
jgi:hypothetical protein